MKPPPSRTGPTLTSNVGKDTCVKCDADVFREHWRQPWMRFGYGTTDCSAGGYHEVVKDLPRSTDRTDVEEWLDR